MLLQSYICCYDVCMHIAAVVNQKGGVGKTNITINLAAVNAEHSRVLVADGDPVQHSASDWAETADQIGRPWAFDFTDDVRPEVLASLRSANYDMIFVDTPGSLAASEIERTGAILDEADFVIVPMEPHPMAVTPMMRTVKSLIEPRGLPYRVLLSRVENKDAMTKRRDDTTAMLDEMTVPRFQTTIRQYVAHSDAPGTGDNVTTYLPTRQSRNAVDDFRALALELTSIWANGEK